MTGNISTAARRVGALKEKFLRDLQPSLARMSERFQRLVEDDRKPDDLVELRQEVHRLAGLSSILEFHELGRTARMADVLLTEWLEAASPSSSQADLALSATDDLLQRVHDMAAASKGFGAPQARVA